MEKIKIHCAFICVKDLEMKDGVLHGYTFCHLGSGNNFTVYSKSLVKEFDSLKSLQVGDYDFFLSFTKSGLKLKLKED